MSTKFICPCAVILALLGMSLAHGQERPPLGPMDTPSYPSAPTTTTVRPSATTPTPPPIDNQMPGLSSWITYTRPDCCGPVGTHGMIGTDLFFRVGPSFPIGNTILSEALETGFMIEGGGHVYFYNPEGDRAWTLGLGLSFNYNNGNRPDITFLLFDVIPVNVRELHRTNVNLSGGREWFLRGSAHDCGPNWRVGGELGGRWGTSRIELNFVPPAGIPPDDFFGRREDVIGGLFIAVHSHVEVPIGCCRLFGGVRLEWNQMWSDIIPGEDANLQDINLLFTAGVRY